MEWYFRLLLVTPRVMVATLLIPIFSTQRLPAGARGATGLALCSISLLSGSTQVIPDASAPMLMILVVKEAAIGAMIGLAFGMVFHVARAIGEIVDYQTASTFSQSFDPQNGQSTSTFGQLLENVFIAFAIASGGMLLFAETLLLSYQLWPVSQMFPSLTGSVPALMIFESSRLLAFALLLAGPMILIAFMIDLGVGFLGRAAPQMNLLGISLPLKAPAAYFVLLLAVPFLLPRLFDALAAVRSALLTLMGA